jgi:hypothetical protein
MENFCSRNSAPWYFLDQITRSRPAQAYFGCIRKSRTIRRTNTWTCGPTKCVDSNVLQARVFGWKFCIELSKFIITNLIIINLKSSLYFLYCDISKATWLREVSTACLLVGNVIHAVSKLSEFTNQLCLCIKSNRSCWCHWCQVQDFARSACRGCHKLCG